MQQAIVSKTKEPVLTSVGDKGRKWLCPDCLAPVYFRRRAGWTDHFCHKPNSVCTTKLASRVSFEHELGKKLLGDRLSQLFPDAQIEVEQGVDNRRRIADVAAIKRNIILAAYECQISPILVRGERGLEERTRDYQKQGIPVTWWFGVRSLTATIRDWCETSLGKGRWEVIEHPQLRLEGYVIQEKKMNNFLGNAIVDCIGLDEVDELMQAKLLEAGKSGDAKAALKISTTWAELKNKKDRQIKINLFGSSEYWTKFSNQILYILREFGKPQKELEISRRAIEIFEFNDSEDWEESILRVYPVFDNQDGGLIPCWNWFLAYSICLEELIEKNLVEVQDDPCNEEDLLYSLTPAGLEEIKKVDLSTLPFKNKEIPSKIKHLYLPPTSSSQGETNSLSSEYIDGFIPQVLSLFDTKSMSRPELYKEAERTFSFTDKDKETVCEKGKHPFPKWKEAYSRIVDKLMRRNYLEYCETNDNAKKNRPYRITDLGRDQLKELQQDAIALSSRNSVVGGAIFFMPN